LDLIIRKSNFGCEEKRKNKREAAQMRFRNFCYDRIDGRNRELKKNLLKNVWRKQ
jgi:hypothetical protein